MLSTGPILNGGGSSLTGGLSHRVVEKCRETELVKWEHCSDVGWEKLGAWGLEFFNQPPYKRSSWVEELLIKLLVRMMRG
jgi:hypothetical protein